MPGTAVPPMTASQPPPAMQGARSPQVHQDRLPDRDWHLTETDPPAELPAGEVVVLQPYGSLFYAAVPAFESQLPTPAGAPGNSVVILRVRGRTDLGTTFMQVLCRYGAALTDTGSKLVIESAGEQLQEQLRTAGVTDVVGPEAPSVIAAAWPEAVPGAIVADTPAPPRSMRLMRAG